MAAQNRPIDPDYYKMRRDNTAEFTEKLLHTPMGIDWPPVAGVAADYTPEEQQQMLQERWEYGGPSLTRVFADTATDLDTNTIVSEFVREKIRGIVKDPAVAAKLLPSYPIATRRPILDTGYYELFNSEHVTLVDVRTDPIERFTHDGVMTAAGEYKLDVVILATGFDAFTGAIESANIRNADGLTLMDVWSHGPRTYLGLMVAGFPNVFFMTGPGSPSVAANMNLGNTFQLDLIGQLLVDMRAEGAARVEATKQAADEWTRHCAEVAGHLVTFTLEHNWLVHFNPDDGSQVVIPYVGGLEAYVEKCRSMAANHWEGLELSKSLASAS